MLLTRAEFLTLVQAFDERGETAQLRKLAEIMGVRGAGAAGHRTLVARLRRSREEAYMGYGFRYGLPLALMTGPLAPLAMLVTPKIGHARKARLNRVTGRRYWDDLAVGQ